MSTGATEERAAAAPSASQLRAAHEAWALMHELFMANRVHFIALCREYDLFPPQLLALRALDSPKRMREIAEMLACDSSNVTGITDRLEERGLVERTAAPDDRRVKMLVLTEAGEKLRAEIEPRFTAPPAEFTELSTADLRELAEIIRRVPGRE